MTHTYHIEGMTCSGCSRSVEAALLAVDQVKQVTVDLENSSATVEMDSHIPLVELEEALQNKNRRYHISAQGTPAVEHQYHIEGMTCDGCRRKVEEHLRKVGGVEQALVDLKEARATILMKRHIPVEVLEAVLQEAGTQYHISEEPSPGKPLVREYMVTGMTCQGCKKHVQDVLENVHGVRAAAVDLEQQRAEITFSHPVPLKTLQESLKRDGDIYGIYIPGEPVQEVRKEKKQNNSGTGKYYCPMHCEGDKIYDSPGDCPVCGMDLVEEVQLAAEAVRYTCPMHREVVEDEPGSCPICGMDLVRMEADASEEKKTYHKLLRKFKIAVAFTVPIFIIAMSEMWSENPLYRLMELQAWNWIQFGLSLPVVFYATWMFFERAWRSIRSLNLNMFTLIGIGAGIAWSFSLGGMLFPEAFPAEFKTPEGTVHVYFEAATVILTLVLLGQLLEARAHGKTNTAIKELLKLAPRKALVVVDGQEKEIDVDAIVVGDVLRVKPGDKIPVDGSIRDGQTHIDESMITGEPVPVDKAEGDSVTSGTINGNRSFTMVAEKVGDQTLLAQIVKMVNEASRSRAPIQKLADRISGYFVPVVIGIAALTFTVWAVFGPEPNYVYALINAIAVLIIACPCALGLATPMSIMVGVGKGAQNGVLVKNAQSLEQMNKIHTLIIDKTGTITQGKPAVEEVVSVESSYTPEEVLGFIASVNAQSEHPLAAATVEHARNKGLHIAAATGFEASTGKGVSGVTKGKKVAIGNEKMMAEAGAETKESVKNQVKAEQDKGRTVSFVALDSVVVGYIAITDPIKPTSKEAISELLQDGVEVIMLTGDNETTASAVAKELHLSGFKAGMLPQQKLEEVKRLQEKGVMVAMAGDGINDAPALAKADIGIAMGTGTDVAIESAEITLVKGDLKGVVKARKLSAKVMENIKQNLFFALVYNTLGVPIAAGILFPFFGILLSPMIAALAMSFSSLSVIANALRLRNARI